MTSWIIIALALIVSTLIFGLVPTLVVGGIGAFAYSQIKSSKTSKSAL